MLASLAPSRYVSGLWPDRSCFRSVLGMKAQYRACGADTTDCPMGQGRRRRRADYEMRLLASKAPTSYLGSSACSCLLANAANVVFQTRTPATKQPRVERSETANTVLIPRTAPQVVKRGEPSTKQVLYFPVRSSDNLNARDHRRRGSSLSH